jgi:hypothetical protein
MRGVSWSIGFIVLFLLADAVSLDFFVVDSNLIAGCCSCIVRRLCYCWFLVLLLDFFVLVAARSMEMAMIFHAAASPPHPHSPHPHSVHAPPYKRHINARNWLWHHDLQRLSLRFINKATTAFREEHNGGGEIGERVDTSITYL